MVVLRQEQKGLSRRRVMYEKLTPVIIYHSSNPAYDSLQLKLKKCHTAYGMPTQKIDVKHTLVIILA
jgi:hypothetical protein